LVVQLFIELIQDFLGASIAGAEHKFGSKAGGNRGSGLQRVIAGDQPARQEGSDAVPIEVTRCPTSASRFATSPATLPPRIRSAGKDLEAWIDQDAVNALVWSGCAMPPICHFLGEYWCPTKAGL
jgi:hypothetical protein